MSAKKEPNTPPFENIPYLALVICAFIVFGVVLAWGDFHSRNVKPTEAEAEHPPVDRFKNAA